MSGSEKVSPDVNGFDPHAPLDPSRALVPSVVKLNEQRVARGFWPKIRKVAAKVPFAAEALSVWYCAKDEETPTAAKGMMLAALAYFVLPTDVVPDFIAGLGYTDDAAVFATLMTLVGRNLKPRHREAAKRSILRLRRDD
ncbi:YkvA family protein [Phenylobacterium sp.]|uniref:YkvA family protein n=1 Tax=Phenylobacterium sp. TaxID=1871053 RepID=UPI002C9133DA|nr:YkvA family protein [Phenylobacterium sp.]HVI31636.1 YkvA family protein [Phenylobacterium sp.]